MQYTELISDVSTYSVLRDGCASVFDTSKRLPEYVFRRKFTNYYAFEHGFIGYEGFAALLAVIAQRFGDRNVNYMTLDPDPVRYYRRNCGFYGVASFDLFTLPERYLVVMFRGGEADSFLARGGDVGVFWGSSAEWGIFCDRKSWELCLLASSAALDDLVLDKAIEFIAGSRIRSYISREYRSKPSIAEHFLKKLAENYPDLA